MLGLIVGLISSCAPDGIERSDKDDAHAFVTSINAWSQSLTEDGEKMGNLLALIHEGNVDELEEFESQLRQFEQRLDAVITDLSEHKLPEIEELSDYRSAFVEYLLWQQTSAAETMRDMVKIAADQETPREERAREIGALLSETNEKEISWKRRLLELREQLYAVLNEAS